MSQKNTVNAWDKEEKGKEYIKTHQPQKKESDVRKIWTIVQSGVI